jgi:hypothetical protein
MANAYDLDRLDAAGQRDVAFEKATGFDIAGEVSEYKTTKTDSNGISTTVATENSSQYINSVNTLASESNKNALITANEKGKATHDTISNYTKGASDKLLS